MTETHSERLPRIMSGTPGSDTVKVKGVINWVAADGVPAEVRMYDRLFSGAAAGYRR